MKFKLLLPLLLVLTFLSTSALGQMGSIKGNKVQLRSGPGTNYSVKWEYGNGFPLKVLSKKETGSKYLTLRTILDGYTKIMSTLHHI